MSTPLTEPYREPKEHQKLSNPIEAIQDRLFTFELRRMMGYTSDPLLSLHNRHSFEKLVPHVRDFSKTTAAITGLLAAGSLTFIGLFGVEKFPDLLWLKVGWTALGLSTLTHLGTFLAVLAVVAGIDRQKNYDEWVELLPFGTEDKDEEKGMQAAAINIKVELHYRQLRNTVRGMFVFLISQSAFLLLGGAALIIFATATI